jgi:hypothetical protein
MDPGLEAETWFLRSKVGLYLQDHPSLKNKQKGEWES